jgi:hypothetical protein
MMGRLFRKWRSLLPENPALRQQLVTLKRRHPRPILGLLGSLRPDTITLQATFDLGARLVGGGRTVHPVSDGERVTGLQRK